jgi:formylglycine-generating enzyme required for sulfatase activity
VVLFVLIFNVVAPRAGVHGNFDWWSWAPTPVGYFPKGKSEFGVYELVGNGWEWTDTKFAGFAGYEPYIKSYPGYSADFFDEQHYVMLGASWVS